MLKSYSAHLSDHLVEPVLDGGVRLPPGFRASVGDGVNGDLVAEVVKLVHLKTTRSQPDQEEQTGLHRGSILASHPVASGLNTVCLVCEQYSDEP